jgi:acetyl-CoA carboxylase biotin carboxylase subunit
VTGIDIVKEQLRIAAGEKLSYKQKEVKIRGHAIECRINAEDPFDGFKPSPGLVEGFHPPPDLEGARIRLDTHVKPGYRIPVYYDSMICKLIVHGADRDAARRGMIAALERFRVEGIKTTIPVHLKILADEGFARGDYDTGFIGRLLG